MRGQMTPLKRMALTQAARVFGRYKDGLWAAVRQRDSLEDSLRCLRILLPEQSITVERLEHYLEELRTADDIRASVEQYDEMLSKGWAQRLSGKGMSSIILCYLCARLLKPQVVVETGCATGWTSTLLLFALQCNQQGRLWSIDIPPKAGQLSMDWTLPAGVSPGFLVPASLRERWTLILGDAREHLGPLLQRQQPVDLFFHDSDHTYQHMMWEYTSIWPSLRNGGILVSDDIGWNTAFWDFATAMKAPMAIHQSNANLGALLKRTPPA